MILRISIQFILKSTQFLCKASHFRSTYCEAKPVENHLLLNKTSWEQLIVKQSQVRTIYRVAKPAENHLLLSKTGLESLIVKQNKMRTAYLKGNCRWAGKSNWGNERISFAQLFFQDCSRIRPEIAFSEMQQHSSAALSNIQDAGSSFLLSLQHHITTLLLLMHSQHAHALFTLTNFIQTCQECPHLPWLHNQLSLPHFQNVLSERCYPLA